MRKFLVSLVCGLAIGGLSVAALAYHALDDRFEHGRDLGRLEGREEAFRVLEAEFGRTNSDAGGKNLLSLKTSSVVAVVVDGVKTIRVVP